MSDASARMQRIGRKDTAPELALRRGLWSLGLRYRVHVRDLPGTPDIVFPRAKLAVFVHGCYWHRHVDCRRTTTPKDNRSFWEAKFVANVARDERQRAALIAAGWAVWVAWECELENDDGVTRVATQIASTLAKLKHKS